MSIYNQISVIITPLDENNLDENSTYRVLSLFPVEASPNKRIYFCRKNSQNLSKIEFKNQNCPICLDKNSFICDPEFKNSKNKIVAVFTLQTRNVCKMF